MKTLTLRSFHTLAPQYRTRQDELLEWLADAHAQRSGKPRDTLLALLKRYGADATDIAWRGHESKDFMVTSDIGKKTAFYFERTSAALNRFYATQTHAPAAIIHVTCTGYASPSAAQALVSRKSWGQSTEVLHAYHMGCYAAHPALRMASGLTREGLKGAVDIVHTELCSLHLALDQQDPGTLIIQSLFADGFIRYQAIASTVDIEGLRCLAARDWILPDTLDRMGWSNGPFTFHMTLAPDVPAQLAHSLPGLVKHLFESAGLDEKAESSRLWVAMHPGGPRILDIAEKALGVSSQQIEHSRHVLREHGNMSSATLPHIWQRMLEDPQVPAGALILSVGAGPGLTLSGMLFRKTV